MSKAKASKLSSDKVIGMDDVVMKIATDIPEDYKPIIIEVSSNKDSIFNYKAEPKYSVNIDLPRFEYGFQHYIHQSKGNTHIFKDFEGKKKAYRVFEMFKTIVDNYDDSIQNTSVKYFKDKPAVINEGFYKLWEILYMFDLIDTNKQITTTHINENNGEFIQAIIYYREMFHDNKNDKHHLIVEKDELKNKIDDEISKKYEKGKSQKIFQHIVSDKQMDSKVSDKADFITANAGLDIEVDVDDILQEQKIFRTIINEILTALKIQNKNGSFVCRFYETFTNTSLKLIYILKEFYDKVHIIKPLTSMTSNAEKYVVCTGFKYNDKDKEFKKYIDAIEDIYKDNLRNKDKQLVNIFPEFELPKKFIKEVGYLNTLIANSQFKTINEMMKFIKMQNFYGDTYQMRRHMQVNANVYWIENLLPQSKNFDEKKKFWNTIIMNITKENLSNIDKITLV